MKTVLVAGAASGVGASIVGALVAAGDTTVLATSRAAERLDALRERLEPEHRSSLTAIVGDAGDFAGAVKIADRVAALGGVDAVVAIFGRGSWTSGPILELAPDAWRSVLDEMLTAHFALARALIPLLRARADSLYLSIGGGAAFGPVADAGLMSIAAAGQIMLTRTLAAELGPGAPRVLELVISGPVTPSNADPVANRDAITAGDVGRVVAEIVLHGATTWEATTTDGPLIVMKQRA